MRERDTTANGTEFGRSVAGEVATVLTVMDGFKRYKHGIKKPSETSLQLRVCSV